MLEFRRNSEKIIRKLKQGRKMRLTYRGAPIALLSPIASDDNIAADDPFYRIYDLAERGAGKITNKEIDRIVYEP